MYMYIYMYVHAYWCTGTDGTDGTYLLSLLISLLLQISIIINNNHSHHHDYVYGEHNYGLNEYKRHVYIYRERETWIYVSMMYVCMYVCLIYLFILSTWKGYAMIDGTYLLIGNILITHEKVHHISLSA